MKAVVIAVIAALMLSPVVRAESPAVAEQGVRAASAAWDEAHNAGDVRRLLALYSNDAVSMPYDRPALEGHAAIESDFRAFFAEFTAAHRTTIDALVITGEWAIERGRYQLSATPRTGGDPLSESGKHIVVRRLVDGAWKVQWEIWNTDAVEKDP